MYFEITNRFGEYDVSVGGIFNIVQYKLPDGRKIELNFGGGNILYKLTEISIKGERIIIFDYFLNPKGTLENGSGFKGGYAKQAAYDFSSGHFKDSFLNE